MPIKLIEMIKGYHPPTTDDRGFLLSLTRQARWNNSATTEAMNLLRAFAEPYYRLKCPEEYEETPDEDSKSESDSQTKAGKSNGSSHTGTKKSYCIQFAIREINNTRAFCFLASNLADPADFAHFMFTKMAVNSKDRPRLPDQPLNITPIQSICEMKSTDVEKTLQPLVEQAMDGDPDYPYRFQTFYHTRTGPADLSWAETTRVVRNCIWAANPNCVQCIKSQDFVVVIEILEPHCFLGVLKEYERLRDYSTCSIERGLKERADGPDSEDDISDDPLLEEQSERDRKLRIKRKRRAERYEQHGGKKAAEEPDVEANHTSDKEDSDKDDDEGEDIKEEKDEQDES